MKPDDSFPGDAGSAARRAGPTGSAGSVAVRRLSRALRVWIGLWERPVPAALMALALYTALAAFHRPLLPASPHAYHNYLADAFLHGQLSLRLLPPSLHDLSLFDGRYYLYWSPMPAILLLPFVAVFGVSFSDILFTLGVGALNVALVARLLREACSRRVLDLSEAQRGWLVLFFVAGTVHVTLAPLGRVWFTSQLVGFMCVALAYLAALRLRGGAAFALTGLALAGALLARNHLALTGLWPACYLLREHRDAGWRRLSAYSLIGAVPVVFAVGLLGAYNWLRFGNVLDNGLAYQQMASVFVDDYRRYGFFSLHFLPTNLFYHYVAYSFSNRPETFQGSSLFLLSPVFFGAFWGLAAGRPRWSAAALAGTIFLTAIPSLLLNGTGWVQFGPRYTLDFTVPLLLLTAIGVRRWPVPWLAVLTAIGVVHYFVGAIWLGQCYAQYGS